MNDFVCPRCGGRMLEDNDFSMHRLMHQYQDLQIALHKSHKQYSGAIKGGFIKEKIDIT